MMGMTERSNARLGIGVLAHDEAARLPVLVDSLFKQSVFRPPVAHSIHVVCVPNGCHDDTAGVARHCLEQAVGRLAGESVTWSVEELATAGKASAWNHCVHTALGDCDFVCLVDADIVFANDDTISAALAVLRDDERVCVATDRALKHHGAKDWLALLSRYFSQATPAGPTEICGQFYCARASVLRNIWLPPGLPVEDGFLRAMVITNEFRAPEDSHRIARAENGAHFYEPKTRPGELWRHKKRLMIGTTLNHLLFGHLWAHAGSDGAGKLLHERLEKDPAWLSRYLAQASEGRRWIVPMGHVFRRLTELGQAPLRKAARRAPAALAATAIDLLAAVSANREIKRTLGLGYW